MDLDGNGQDAGDKIVYSYSVKNDGNISLLNVTATDDKLGAITLSGLSDLDGDGDADDLAVGATATGTATAFLTQGQVDAGTVTNIVTGNGTGTNGTPVSDTDTNTVGITRAPSIDIEKRTLDGTTTVANVVSDFSTKAGDGKNILVGETVTWIYKVSNTGNVTLTTPGVTDSQPVGTISLQSGDTNANGKLDVGETWYYTAVGTAAAGTYTNSGTANASYIGGTVTDNDGSSYFGANAQITIDKRTFDGTSVTGANVATAFGSAGDGRNILTGEGITWIYAVKRDSTGNVDLSNITVTDSTSGVTPTLLAQVGGDTDNILEAGETWYYTAGGTAVTGAYSNTGTASGSYTDSAGHTATDTATDNSNYFGANPSLAIDKTTKVLPSGTAGDGVIVTPGSPMPSLQWIYKVTNTGNVTLTNIQVKDDNGTPLNLLDDKVVGTIASLAAGASTTLTLNGTVTAGSYTNIGSASANYSDSAGHNKPVSATDASSYLVTGGLVTNSSLCTFDTNGSLAGKQFNLLFTPDFLQGSGNYKISDTNPGQFYYNMFYNGAPNSTITVDLNIPYPFVTQGAVPIHVYDDVGITTVNGQTCLTPIGEIANYKLTDAGVTWLYVDANGNNVQDSGDVYRLTITNVSTGDDGFIYLNLHLDYGLEKQTGWVKSSPSTGIDNALDNPNLADVKQAIMDNTAYNFSALVNGGLLSGSSDTIINDNIFKNIKGVGGLFQSDRSGDSDADHTAVQGQKIAIFKVSDGSLQGTATTDVDGWYFAQFLATGSKTSYQAVWDQNGNGNYAEDITAGRVKVFDMGGSAGKYAEASFTVTDPTGFNPPSDVVIDGYSGFYAGLLV